MSKVARTAVNFQDLPFAQAIHLGSAQATKPAGPLPLLDAKPQIVQALRQARVQRLMRAYVDEMVKAEPIQVNEIELTKAAKARK